MILTNYWLLLIWLAVGGGLMAVGTRRTPMYVLGKTEYRWSRLAAFVLVLPYIVWAGNRRYFGDTSVYRATFLALPTIGIDAVNYLSAVTKDRGFTVLSIILKTFIGGNDTLFFLIIAAFQMFCIVHFCRRYSDDFFLCIFMFVVSTDYLSFMFNGMRQFIAVGMTLLSFCLLLRRKYVPAVLVILFASTIHKSSLIMLPIFYVIHGEVWNKRTLLMIAATVAVIASVARFTSFLDAALANTQYSDIITNGIWENDDGTNILRALFYSIPAGLAFVGRREVARAGSPLVNMCVNCSICTAALYFLAVFTSGIYVGRLPIYTTIQGYAVTPWLINHMFSKSSAKTVTAVLMCAYVVFFYYQIHFSWNML